jgi:beta-galactosidase
MGIVQAARQAGSVTVEVTSRGLTPATVTIATKAAKFRPAVPLWHREVPAGAGITGLWRPVPPAAPAGGGGFGMAGAADTLFILKQEGSKLTGTVEGAGGGGFGGGGDQSVAIEDGKVDGSNVSFRAGMTTYSGTVERGELQLQRTFAGGRGGGFGPGGPPTPPAGAIVPLGQSAGSAPPAVGPPPDGSDPSSAAFVNGGGVRRGQQAGPLVLRKVVG